MRHIRIKMDIAKNTMAINYPVYTDGVIAVSLSSENDEAAKKFLFHLSIRWLSPKPYKDKNDIEVHVTNIMGGETDWFILPGSF